MIKIKSIVFLLFFSFLLNNQFIDASEVTSNHIHHHSHDHSHHHEDHLDESPHFKYSREANEKYSKNNHQNDHHPNENLIKQTKEVWLSAIGSTLLISIVPYLILTFIPINNPNEHQSLLKILLSFASGGLLGDAFLHLIPHALIAQQELEHKNVHSHSHSHKHSNDNHEHSHDMSVGLWVLSGILVFLMIEKFVRIVKGSHCHHLHEDELDEKADLIKEDEIEEISNNEKNEDEIKESEEIKVAGYLNLAADFAHNFTDGLAIGASYLAGNSIGLVTTLTILFHEVPHEIGDFAILIQSGCSKSKAMTLQLITAVGALSGTILSLAAEGLSSSTSSWILPFTAGGFIYIATVSVIPELLEGSNLKQSFFEIIALIVGVLSMVLIAQYE